jgi:hypothetical protein
MNPTKIEHPVDFKQAVECSRCNRGPAPQWGTKALESGWSMMVCGCGTTGYIFAPYDQSKPAAGWQEPKKKAPKKGGDAPRQKRRTLGSMFGPQEFGVVRDQTITGTDIKITKAINCKIFGLGIEVGELIDSEVSGADVRISRSIRSSVTGLDVQIQETDDDSSINGKKRKRRRR